MGGERRGGSTSTTVEPIDFDLSTTSQSSAAAAANGLAGRAATDRIAGNLCRVHVPVDEEHAAGPAGETEVELDDGSLCAGSYDPSSRTMELRLDDKQADAMFGKSGGLANMKAPSFGGFSIGGGGLAYSPNANTRISVGRSGGKWRATLRIKF